MAIPWSSVNDEGDVVPSVVVRYRVLAAPRLGTVRVVSIPQRGDSSAFIAVE